jgi:hypothetical protein
MLRPVCLNPRGDELWFCAPLDITPKTRTPATESRHPGEPPTHFPGEPTLGWASATERHPKDRMER